MLPSNRFSYSFSSINVELLEEFSSKWNNSIRIWDSLQKIPFIASSICLLESRNWVQISDVELGFQLVCLTQAIKIFDKGAPFSAGYCTLALFVLSIEHHCGDHKYSVVSRSTLHRRFSADEKDHTASTQNHFLYNISSTITLSGFVSKFIHTDNVCYFL